MTIEPKQAAFGPANIGHRLETGSNPKGDRTERATVTRLEVRRSTHELERQCGDIAASHLVVVIPPASAPDLMNISVSCITS